jgi:phospholipid/cholesterol/gamma-HCH transport system substrate-binding protein
VSRRIWRRAPLPASRDRSWQYRRAGLVALLAFAAITIAVFVRQNPLGTPYELRAEFSSTSQLRTGSEVRTAGVQIGEVSSIDGGPHGSAVVTMTIDNRGRPVHADATATVEPRLILEGNGYVALDPGTPSAPELQSGSTIPQAQTSIAVQLDQALDTFDLQTRRSLTSSVRTLATGLAAPGYGGLRRSVRELAGALGSVTAVAHAARGTAAGDLTDAIGSTRDVAGQLASDPAVLGDLVTSYADVSRVLAADRRIAPTVRSLDDLLRSAPVSLQALRGALPALTDFSNALRPALRRAPGALTATSALLDQVSALVAPAELPALLRALDPVLGGLPELERRLGALFGYSTPVTDCIATHVVPTLEMKINDGPNTTGDPVYLDALHMFAGLTALSSAVDGNGGTVRLGVANATGIVDQLLPGVGSVVGRATGALGVSPTWLGPSTSPDYRPDAPCAAQPLPDLGARSGPAPDWARGGTR